MMIGFGTYMTANDGTRWEVVSPSESTPKGAIKNLKVTSEIQGPTPYALHGIQKGSLKSALQLLIDDVMVKHIKECTEEEARFVLKNDTWSTSVDEIYAFIGLIYIKGALCKGQCLSQLWSKVWGPPVFHLTMSRDRFRNLLRFVRFDSRSTRAQRLQTNKFALISDIWYKFIQNSITCYKPYGNITVGDKLLSTKAKCPFAFGQQTDKSRVGIKFWMAVDAESKYLLNAFPLLEKKEKNVCDQTYIDSVVMHLLDPFLGQGQNITTDESFTSVSLAEKLKMKNTYIVGSINHAKKEIPQSVQVPHSNLFDTLILKNNDFTLTSYQHKKGNNRLILSTMHQTVSIGETQKKIPESVNYYDSTRQGVEALDKMVNAYSTKTGSSYWAIHVFYNILDLAGINASILYKEITGLKINRRDFLLQLSEELIKNFTNLNQIHENQTHANVYQDMFLSKSVPVKRRECQVLLCRRNKTKEYCIICKKAVCGTCTRVSVKKCICVVCGENCINWD